jgi:hypothetical protein
MGGTKITRAGLDDFQKALPKCFVESTVPPPDKPKDK